MGFLQGAATPASIRSALAADPAGALEELGSTVNHQSFAAKKVSAWDSSAAPPVRILQLGDSFSTGLFLGPRMGLAGRIGLGRVTGSGTITDLSGRFDYWMNGKAVELAVGATTQWTIGSSPTGDLRGDRACVAYIKRSGGGSFVLQYASNGGGSADPAVDTGWTTLATIDTANATTIGGYNEYSLPTSNAPFFRLRIKTVTTGSVVIITTGIYNSNGGGTIWMPVASQTGTTFAQMAETPVAVLDQIWPFLAPDVVLSCELDDAAEWDSGGNFRTLYDRLIALEPEMDWVQIGQHNVDMTDIRNVTVDVPASNLAMRNWAKSANQTFVDVAAFLGTYDQANAAGLMGDHQHLNTAGYAAKNVHLWHTLPLGNMDLGGLGTSVVDGTLEAVLRYSSISGNISSQPVECLRPLTIRSANGGLKIFARASLFSNANAWEIFNDSNDLKILYSGITGVILGTSSDAGIHPSFDGAKLGRTSFRWKLWADGIQANIVNKTTAFTATTADHTITCDATSAAFTITLPAAASNSGRIYAIVKTDASVNAVTIDGNASETINGATTLDLAAQWDRCQIQSNGTNWIRIA